MDILEKKNDVSSEETMIRHTLLKIGVPDHLRGHSYLMTAINIVANDPAAVYCITKKVYAPVAKKCDTTTAKVEKSIRNAIDTAWVRADLEVLRKYFGGTVDPIKGRPTAREFITRIANIIRTGV